MGAGRARGFLGVGRGCARRLGVQIVVLLRNTTAPGIVASRSECVVEFAAAVGFDALGFGAGSGGGGSVFDVVAVSGDVGAFAGVVARAAASLVAGEQGGHAVGDVVADADEDEAAGGAPSEFVEPCAEGGCEDAALVGVGEGSPGGPGWRLGRHGGSQIVVLLRITTAPGTRLEDDPISLEVVLEC